MSRFLRNTIIATSPTDTSGMDLLLLPAKRVIFYLFPRTEELSAISVSASAR